MDFSFADLRNVDFSSANLDRASLFRIKYDEGTRFPEGFVIEPKLRMEWKGAVDRDSEYRAYCSVEELLTLIPPPSAPSYAEGDWEGAEAQMGIVFPSDFKQLISAYGSGEILGELRIFNPLTAGGRKSIADNLEVLADIRDGGEYRVACPPWRSPGCSRGATIQMETSTAGWPEVNRTIGRRPNWATVPTNRKSDDVNMTTFLFNYARNQYPEMQAG